MWCLIYVDVILMPSPHAPVLSEIVEAMKKDLTLTSLQTLSQSLSHECVENWILNVNKYVQKLQGKFQLRFTPRNTIALATSLSNPILELLNGDRYSSLCWTV